MAPSDSEEQLRTFVARTRPPGRWPARFWPDGKRAVEGAGSARAWINVLAGIALIYGLLFGAGQAFFGRGGQAAVLLGLAALGGGLLWRNLKRESA